MHITHVVQSLGVGGQEMLVLNLSRRLLQLGHSVSVVSLTPDGDLRPHFGDIPVHDASRAPGLDPLLTFRLSRLFAKLRPDVVHTHNPSPLIYAAPAARLAGVSRVVHTKHGVNPYGPAARFAQRVNLPMLRAFVAVSGATASIARRQDFVPERLLHTIENGIPLERFGPDGRARFEVRDELGIPRDAFVLGSVGRLAPEKNYPLLVRAMLPLLSASRRLVLVGSGPAEADIRRCVPPSLMGYVTFAGARSDVPRLLTAFDLFALTSTTEGLPLAVPEAMASGLPVVATRVGSLPEIVTTETGALCDSEDLEALRSVLATLISRPQRCAAMGAAAREHALKRFSIQTTARRYTELYAPAGRVQAQSG